MDSIEHQTTITRKRVFLVEHLDLNNTIILDQLVQDGVLSSLQLQAIKETSLTNTQRVSALLDHLHKKSSHDWELFLKALTEHDHGHVVAQILGSGGDASYNVQNEQPQVVAPMTISDGDSSYYAQNQQRQVVAPLTVSDGNSSYNAQNAQRQMVEPMTVSDGDSPYNAQNVQHQVVAPMTVSDGDSSYNVQNEQRQVVAPMTVFDGASSSYNAQNEQRQAVAPMTVSAGASSSHNVQTEESPRFANWSKGPLLGFGAHGQVFLYTTRDTGKQLAVKQVPYLKDQTDPKKIEDLKGEILGFLKLRHERIVMYDSIHFDQSFLNICLEYMPGGSLKKLVQNKGHLSEQETRGFTKQVLEGLSYLHDMNIIHRDIKCANVLLDVRGDVKIGDFGICKQIATINSHTVTGSAKSSVGTPYWMAPEVIKGESYGRKADIWSIGCTVVEMLTGNPPWHEREPHAAMFQIGRTGEADYTLTDASEAVREFLKCCFYKEPERRESARSLLDHAFIR